MGKLFYAWDGDLFHVCDELGKTEHPVRSVESITSREPDPASACECTGLAEPIAGDDLEGLTKRELVALAEPLGVATKGLTNAALREAIRATRSQAESPGEVSA